MKATSSSLNAYAKSYVPLSKRGAFSGQKEFKPPKEFVAVEPHLWYPSVQAPQTQNIHNVDAYNSSVNSGPMGHAVHGYHSLSLSNPSEVKDKATVDEVFEYNLAYLQETFPGMSYESLSHVYVANNCDIDATVDMLNHLESINLAFNSIIIFQCYGSVPFSSSEKLPYTLDIGDVPESGAPNELPFQKMKDLNIKAGASSSGVSG